MPPLRVLLVIVATTRALHVNIVASCGTARLAHSHLVSLMVSECVRRKWPVYVDTDECMQVRQFGYGLPVVGRVHTSSCLRAQPAEEATVCVQLDDLTRPSVHTRQKTLVVVCTRPAMRMQDLRGLHARHALTTSVFNLSKRTAPFVDAFDYACDGIMAKRVLNEVFRLHHACEFVDAAGTC